MISAQYTGKYTYVYPHSSLSWNHSATGEIYHSVISLFQRAAVSKLTPRSKIQRSLFCAYAIECVTTIWPISYVTLDNRISLISPCHAMSVLCKSNYIKSHPSTSHTHLSSVVEWLGRRTQDSRVEGSTPGHDTAWLFISKTGDRLRGVNCLGTVSYTHLTLPTKRIV